MEWELKRIKKTVGPVMSLSPAPALAPSPVSEAGAGHRDTTGHRAHAPPLPQCLADPRLP